MIEFSIDDTLEILPRHLLSPMQIHWSLGRELLVSSSICETVRVVQGRKTYNSILGAESSKYSLSLSFFSWPHRRFLMKYA